MTRRWCLLLVIFLASTPIFAASNPTQTIDRIIANERALSDTMRSYSPMVETYLQRMQPDSLGIHPQRRSLFSRPCAVSAIQRRVLSG
jgi:hypothetical protein